MNGVFGSTMRPDVSGHTIKIHKIGSFKMPSVDFSFLDLALEKFRPIIRGFIALMLLIYNFNQYAKLIHAGHIADNGTPDPNYVNSKGGKK